MSKILNELSVIIPCKDDHLRIGENIKEISNYLTKNIRSYEIIIVSNGSEKQSIVYLESIKSNFLNLEHLLLVEAGKGLAVRHGLKNAKYKNILFIDADSSVKITEFDKFILNGKLISGFVVGNRKNKDSENINSPILRRISGFLYLKLIKILFKLNYEDTQCGFKAIDRSIFKEPTSFNTNGFSFDLELFLLANKQNVSISEVPVKYIHNSESKVKIIRDTIKMLADLITIYKLR